MWANSEGSGETAPMRRLAWAFAGRLCDKYHNLMSWLYYDLSEAFEKQQYMRFNFTFLVDCQEFQSECIVSFVLIACLETC